MSEFLAAAALLILTVTAIALFRVLRSGIVAERMMAAQLLGSGGAAALLLLGASSESEALSDVALLLTLLAAFSCVAFALGAAEPAAQGDSSKDLP